MGDRLMPSLLPNQKPVPDNLSIPTLPLCLFVLLSLNSALLPPLFSFPSRDRRLDSSGPTGNGGGGRTRVPARDSSL